MEKVSKLALSKIRFNKSNKGIPSKRTRNKVYKLSKKELCRLADLMDVGFLNDDLDKDDMALVLTTEPESKILKALKQLKEL